MPYDREIEVARSAAACAAQLALDYQPGIVAETKADLSPVTRADREAEQLVTRMLLEAFPNDGLLGEEGANAQGTSGRRWIIDPIDGTRDYLRGNALWSNLIALEEQGEIVAGVVHLPVMRETYWASRGAGAFCNGLRIHVSDKKSIEEAVLCVNAGTKLDAAPFRDKLLNMASRFWSMRSLGGGPDAMLLASGKADMWIEISASPWDFAPLKIIMEEAGAVYLNFDGGRTIYAGNCIACTPGLEWVARDLLGLDAVA